MSYKCYLPCFKCGKELVNALPNETDNLPYEGTIFTTEGNYGSTFWDSFDGEEIVINICDSCLREHTKRIGQQKRYLPVRCEGLTGLGRQYVDRPLVPFTGNPDDSQLYVEVDDLGNDLPGVEWASDIKEKKEHIKSMLGI